MKRLLTSLVIIMLAVVARASSQTKADAGASPREAKPAAAALTPQQSTELEEAVRLSATVVRLYNEGKYGDALNPARRALEIRERVLGPENELVTDALGNLASVHLALNNFKEAEPLYQRLLAPYEKRYGAESLKVARLLDVLGLLRYVKGDKGKAEDYYLRSLAIKEKLYGRESNELSSTLYRLAEFYQATENLDKAEPFYRQLVAIREKTFGPEHEQTAEALDRYACLMWKMNRRKEAEALEQRAYGGPEDKLPVKDSSVEGGVLNGKAISLPIPPYPPEARFQGVRGHVTVKVLIGETGKVIRACAVEGPPLLRRVSELAALKSLFTPTLLSGQPVKVTGVITYSYTHF